MLESLGKVVVAAAGTPARATANRSDPVERYECHAFMIEVDASNTGKIYVGNSAMNKTTLAGVYAVLPVPGTNTIPTFSTTISYAINPLNLDDVWIDADTNGEGALVAAMIA